MDVVRVRYIRATTCKFIVALFPLLQDYILYLSSAILYAACFYIILYIFISYILYIIFIYNYYILVLLL